MTTTKYYTKSEVLANGFAKIGQDTSGIFICARFYNPTTKGYFSTCVRDYDYSDCSRDNDELYYMDVDENVLRQFKVDNNIVFDGATIEVYKGRKVPIGTVATVERIKPFYDRYGRNVCDYAYLSNGMRTNVLNCKVIG